MLWCYNWQIAKYLDQFSKRRWWNSTRKIHPSEIFQNRKNRGTIFEPDASRSRTSLKDWTWPHYDGAEDSVYYNICKNVDHYNILNDIRVENSFIKTGYSYWKHTEKVRSTENMDLNTIFFHQCESSYFHQRPIQRLVEIIKSTENVYEMVKSNVTEEGQNRARLIKII